VSKKDKNQPKQTAAQNLVGWMKSIAIALVLWIFMRSLLIEAFHITSGSMENTLLVGDVLFVNKALYGAQLPVVGTKLPAFREPKRSDVVIFESVDEPDLTVVKRVIGMPGDTLEMRSNYMYLNGKQYDEPYVVRLPDTTDIRDYRFVSWQRRYLVPGTEVETYHPTLKNWGPIIVPPDSFFVMGDNRDNSLDSRYWGFLGRDRVRGRAAIIYYSRDPNGILPLTFITAIRWNRILTLIR
jgi:signal peptidase I